MELQTLKILSLFKLPGRGKDTKPLGSLALGEGVEPFICLSTCLSHLVPNLCRITCFPPCLVSLEGKGALISQLLHSII